MTVQAYDVAVLGGGILGCTVALFLARGPLPGIENAFVIGCVWGGFSHGPLVGRMLADLILGREPEMPLFDPARLLDAP